MRLKVLLSVVHDPWFNLATEDWIFKDMDPSYQVLYLWRNSETVVIGRHQNPWSECNLQKMADDDVKLARRQSGGGAVYHDLGNTNFTFLSGKDSYKKENNFQIIINALKKFEIYAEVSGRNDLVVGQKKVSGSAFKESKDRAFHHGTLLMNTNLQKLAGYLNPDKKKLLNKGISSVKSRVANLSEFNTHVNHDTMGQAIINEFFSFYGETCEIEVLNQQKLKQIPELNQYYEQLGDWHWRFGKTPKFAYHLSERFEWGGVDVHLTTKEGRIALLKIYSDSLFPEMIDRLTAALTGMRYEKQDAELAINKLMDAELPYHGALYDFKNWLIRNIG